MTPQAISPRPIDAAGTGAVRAAKPPPPAPRLPSEPVLPNPQLRLDANLGLVVIEFRDRGGQPRTIPTERELDAYRINGVPDPQGEPTAARITIEAEREG